MNVYSKDIDKLPQYSISTIGEKDLDKIQNVCNSCSDFYLLDKGVVADKDEAKNIINSLPNGKTFDDQFNFGIFNESNNLIGLVHIIKDYPNLDVWMLGLMLIDPNERNKGLGMLVHNEIVNFIKNHKGNKIRIGVLKENKNALRFWRLAGYELEKEIEMDRDDNIVKKILVFNYNIWYWDNRISSGSEDTLDVVSRQGFT